MAKISYKSKNLIVGLILTLVFLLFWNTYNVFYNRDLWALIPIILQASIVLLIMIKSRYQITLIKLWALLLIIAGSAGILALAFDILSEILNDRQLQIRWIEIIQSVVKLIGGIFYFYFAVKYVEVSQ